MDTATNIVIGVFTGLCSGAYVGVRVGKYSVVKGLYNFGKVEEKPTIFNSSRILKKYIKSLDDQITILEGELERAEANPSLN